MVPYQRTLLGTGEPWVDEGAATERIELDEESWVDVTRVWLRGADTLLDELIECIDWKQGRRRMYDRMLDDPRLSRWYPAGAPRPHPTFRTMTKHLEASLGVPLPAVGCNYYRDGNDSVAWHADRELRELDDTRIAIVTLGARRPFLLRPKGGGRSIDIAPASGDLLVMGGACQMGWEHSVPKKRASGPRISCSWRWCRPPTPASDDEQPRAAMSSHAGDRLHGSSSPHT